MVLGSVVMMAWQAFVRSSLFGSRVDSVLTKRLISHGFVLGSIVMMI